MPDETELTPPEFSEDDEPDAPACTCPTLDPDDWDGVESDWSDITFLRTTVPAAAGVPVGFNARRMALSRRARELGAAVPPGAMLLIAPGRFRRELLLEVEDAPEGAGDLLRPGGIAYSRLHEAPLGDMRRLGREFSEEVVAEYSRLPRATYHWYLTCRICSDERNYETLFIAHLSSSDKT